MTPSPRTPSNVHTLTLLLLPPHPTSLLPPLSLISSLLLHLPLSPHPPPITLLPPPFALAAVPARGLWVQRPVPGGTPALRDLRDCCYTRRPPRSWRCRRWARAAGSPWPAPRPQQAGAGCLAPGGPLLLAAPRWRWRALEAPAAPPRGLRSRPRALGVARRRFHRRLTGAGGSSRRGLPEAAGPPELRRDLASSLPGTAGCASSGRTREPSSASRRPGGCSRHTTALADHARHPVR